MNSHSKPRIADSELSTGDYEALLSTLEDLASHSDMQEMLERILEKACELTSSPDGSVILFNEDRQSLFFACARGEKADELMVRFGEHCLEQIPVGESIAGSVFMTGQSQLLNLVKAENNHYKGVDARTDHVTETMVCVPLTTGSKRLGVIQLLNKTSPGYTARDLTVLHHFAPQAALSLERARNLADLVAHMGFYVGTDSRMTIQSVLGEINRQASMAELSLLFVDMRGFTQLCQRVESVGMAQSLLNEFLSNVVEVIVKHEGVVNKFLGDGIFAFFSGERKQIRAVKAAAAIVTSFEQTKNGWDARLNFDISDIDVGCGIATGDVMVGKMGTRRIRDYTVIGSTVNLAASFENAARQGRRIIIDNNTLHAASEVIMEYERLDNHILKKDDQETGTVYKKFWVKSIKAEHIPRLFICHATVDKEFVRSSIVEPLARKGIDAWWDVDIEMGEDYVHRLSQELKSCRGFIVVVSSASKSSSWVQREVGVALNEKQLIGRILPICLDDTVPGDLNVFLGTLQRIDTNYAKRTIVEDLMVAISGWMNPRNP